MINNSGASNANGSSDQVSCLMCSKPPFSSEEIYGHVAVDHFGFLRFGCPKCDFKAPYEDTVLNHVIQRGHGFKPIDYGLGTDARGYLNRLANLVTQQCRVAAGPNDSNAQVFADLNRLTLTYQSSAKPQVISAELPSLDQRDTPSTQSVNSSSSMAFVDLSRGQIATPVSSGPAEDISSDEANGHSEADCDQICDSFEAMNLKEELLRGIYAYGFAKPASIQQQIIHPCCNGHDVIVKAPSGAGKTAALAIAVLQQIDVKSPQCQALVLAPTRALAQQIHKMIVALGDCMQVKCHACIGETNVHEDKRILDAAGIHVVVGSPGRVKDMIRRRSLRTHHAIKIFVLDDAYQMFSRDLVEKIYEMFKTMPETVQLLLLSAKMPSEVLEFAKKCMNDPVCILATKDDLALEDIRQFHVFAGKDERKLDVLCDLLGTVCITQVLIFCNTRCAVTNLAKHLTERKFTASSMHGNMDQTEREEIMRQFRSGSSRALISTDVIRGNDVQAVSLVIINYDLCNDRETYIRRIGSSGWFGRKGIAISIITEQDKPTMEEIEEYYDVQIDKIPVNLADLL